MRTTINTLRRVRTHANALRASAALTHPPSLSVSVSALNRCCAQPATNIAQRTYTTASNNNNNHDNGKPRILVTGSVGQIGTELVSALRTRYGVSNVIASDIKAPPRDFPEGPFVWADVMNYDVMARVILENRIDSVIHLASLLSAIGEQNPQLAMKLNTRGIENVLELARLNKLKVFSPSTIAVFGASSPRDMTPDETIMRPSTIYGVTKVYLELLGEYYHRKYGVDFRSVRYPGVISNLGLPGGGTTDYAVEIYHEAVKKGSYTCFLREETQMPMMYMPDCIDAVIQLMEAPAERLTQRVYNVTSFSLTPMEVTKSIQELMPNFQVKYQPDYRQSIADSWPKSLDDSKARQDWGWNPGFDLRAMTKDMLEALKHKYNK